MFYFPGGWAGDIFSYRKRSLLLILQTASKVPIPMARVQRSESRQSHWAWEHNQYIRWGATILEFKFSLRLNSVVESPKVRSRWWAQNCIKTNFLLNSGLIFYFPELPLSQDFCLTVVKKLKATFRPKNSKFRRFLILQPICNLKNNSSQKTF